MHTCFRRIMEISTMTLSAYLVGLVIIVGSTLVPFLQSPSPPQPVITVFNISNSQLLQIPVPAIFAQGENPPPVHDHLFVAFTMRANFAPVWDWNTKGVYVSCIGRYRTDRYVVNEVTLYDEVIKDSETAARWAIDDARKYPLEDAHFGTLAGVRVQLVVRYQVLRYFGYSPIHEVSPMGQTSVAFEVPSKYTTIRRND
ncbi:hypothetical protein DQ04_06561020 [Trypanosoma grayi]|uniref:hypothetical protein n=1 Tax=Trypanosoma grayi TaxID=71804 RepID=UPI0004F40DBC|nr:hypothetical protein DQ04_06561020 [Trypanosoma grayi]KEG08727.1 hypothetical protein DQ04_06561020 [Trypanosoma grayi]